jgi:hypothetical protein
MILCDNWVISTIVQELLILNATCFMYVSICMIITFFHYLQVFSAEGFFVFIIAHFTIFLIASKDTFSFFVTSG